MQKREQGKSGGAAGGTAAPSAKRGRPFGSTAGGAASAFSADSVAPSTLFGPSLQIQNSFAEQNNKRIVLALQSGLKSELTWALNTLTLLSKDDMRKDACLAKIPGLLDALLQIIDDWHDMALPKELKKGQRARTLGATSVVTGFGNEYEALGTNTLLPQSGLRSGSSAAEISRQKNTTKVRPSEWWFDEDGLFNLDDEGRAEKQQCAVAASNIIRNFSFMPENEIAMAQHRHCLETVFQCIEGHIVEDEELVTNAIETIVNLAPLLDLRIFSSPKPSYIKITEKRAVQAIMGMLGSPVKAWHCAAAEFLGRMIINPAKNLNLQEKSLVAKTNMPRRNSGRSASRPALRRAPARSPPPQPAQHAPPPAPVQSGSGGSLLGGIGSTIAQGMAFGTGSAVAHRAVDAVMGPRTIQHETVVSEAAAVPAPTATTNSFAGSDACSIHSKAFQDCLSSYGNEISKCQFYMDMLSECRKNSGSMLGA